MKLWEMLVSVCALVFAESLLTTTFWGRVMVALGCGACAIFGMVYGQTERRKGLPR